MFNLQFNKLKSEIKDGTEVTLSNFSSVLMMRLIFHINYYQHTEKCQGLERFCK